LSFHINVPVIPHFVFISKLMEAGLIPDDNAYNLQQWLEEVYFDSEKPTDLTRNDIAQLGSLLRKILRFDPSS
jgi:serine/threonine-protein kinase SRPK3